MFDGTSITLDGSTGDTKTEPPSEPPPRGSAHKRPRDRRLIALAKTTGVMLIIVGVLYPFGEWFWRYASDWVLRTVVPHLCNLETLLRSISGLSSGYPS